CATAIFTLLFPVGARTAARLLAERCCPRRASKKPPAAGRPVSPRSGASSLVSAL
ncbi:MAG: hypothetical protein AVDCRST_MAG19-3015, partial [uncultured Thermomicrobiales bacterium]